MMIKKIMSSDFALAPHFLIFDKEYYRSYICITYKEDLNNDKGLNS